MRRPGRLLAIYHDYKGKADAMDAEAEVPEDATAHPDASPGAEKYGAANAWPDADRCELDRGEVVCRKLIVAGRRRADAA
jgi:hypothetical protein